MPYLWKVQNQKFPLTSKQSQIVSEQTEARLVYTVSLVPWCHWSTTAFANSGPCSVTEKPYDSLSQFRTVLIPTLFSTIVPQSITIVPESWRNLWSNFLLWWNESISTPHSFRTHPCVCVCKHRKMSGRTNVKYWQWLSEIFAEWMNNLTNLLFDWYFLIS